MTTTTNAELVLTEIYLMKLFYLPISIKLPFLLFILSSFAVTAGTDTTFGQNDLLQARIVQESGNARIVQESGNAMGLASNFLTTSSVLLMLSVIFNV